MAPLFDKADTPMLKSWVVKRLEDNSDADADVLADYVLALLQHDGDVASIRKLCEEETKDFLKEEDSSTFINDVFKVLANKSYLPPSARPKPAESHSYDPTLPLEGFQPIQTPQYPGTAPLNGSRKRSYHEGLGDEGQGPSYYPGARRAFKQPRRGYGVPDAPLDYGAPSFPPAQAASPNLLSASSAYANIPPLDPTHTQAFPFPPSSYPGQAMARPNPYMRKKKPRCWEFDSKGYCSRGLTCKYDHSIDFSAMQPPQLPAGGDTDEGYDPEDPTFILHAPPPLPMPPPVNHGRGSSRRRRGESRRGGRGRGRAAFSADGPLKDPKRTAIVVENIPEESFSEDLVRDFFSQFGTIVEVSMRPYKHLAIVKFDSHQTANAAYRSPKVIFDNRFVKVFWYKEEADGPTLGRGKASNGTNGHEGTPSEQDGPEIDMEDFMQKQAEAQKAYEEKRERREALQKQKEELDKRQQELIEKQLQAKQKLEARLGSAATGDETPNSTAGSLRMQLKKLEEEARILGLDPHDQSHAHGEGSTTSHEGVWTRGGYRGRGGYRARGRGRGGYRGGYGGGYGDVHEAYAAYSLDNRPRKVAVTGADFTVPANDEALRQFLLGVGDYTAIEATPSTTHIAFKDRRAAESFYVGLNGKPLPGREDTLSLAWVPNGTPSIAPPAKEEQQGEAMEVEPSRKEESAEAKGEGKEEKVEKEEREEGEVQQGDMDYEVADESEWIE